ncbi:hypothetical protein ABES02_09285 [Neobacillus pocheonensis]|uniref:DUF7164 domain-containing protein n=1 Tax=Neobacillus pocheonensis TaxID=363869 RepID=UPI003D2C9EDF
MSFPNTPPEGINPIEGLDSEQVALLLLVSIAFEELGLAHLINTEAEKLQGAIGTLVDADGYKGVASMYGCEIAANHFVEQIKIDGARLDYGSASSESIDNHPHIHCWHTDNMFSKFQFTAGNYDHLSKDHLNVNTIKDYCLYIALKSKESFHVN